MPVHLFGNVGVVDDLNGDRYALAHLEDRAWHHPVVADSTNDAGGSELERHRSDLQREVGLGRLLAGHERHDAGGEGSQAADFDEISAFHQDDSSR